jgi:parvulin-like peptidyl-prolyl isomerase
MRSRTLAVSVAIAAAMLVAGCGGGGGKSDSTQSSEDVPANAVAIVAGTPILRTQYDRFFKQAEAAYESQGQEFPKAGTPEYAKLQSQAVDFLLQRAEFEKEAQGLGITVTDGEIDKKLTELKNQFFEGDDAKYQQELKNQGLSEADVKADLEAQLLSEKIFNQVTKGATVSDEQLKTYYDEHGSDYTTAEKRQVAHILVDSKSLADKIYAQLQDGADFAELAKKYSTDKASAKNGGELTDEKGSFVPEFEKVAFALDTGEIGEPVKSQYGWHVIRALSDTQPAAKQSFAEVKATIRGSLLSEQRNTKMTDWVNGVRAKYGPQVAYAVGFEPVGISTGAATTGP